MEKEINKKISLQLIFILLSPSLLAQECTPVHPHQRDLIILPDTAGEESITLLGYNAVNNFQTDHLHSMLISKAAPILVELSIWKRFIKRIQTESLKVELVSFNFYTHKNFLLCIPQQWLQHYQNSGFNLTKWQQIHHSQTLKPNFLDLIQGTVKSILTRLNLYTSLVTALQELLIPKNKYQYCSWNIVLFGHGGPGIGSYAARVAGIPFKEFQKLLTFLEYKISTNIFLYSTCYAGSKWLLKAYTTHGKENKYSFPIILTGITEAPVYAWHNEASIYPIFFQKIKTISLCKKNISSIGIIAGTILQALLLRNKEKKIYFAPINNTLQIRWQHETEFHIIELNHIIQTACSLQQSPQQEKHSLVASQTFIINTPYLHRNIILPGEDHVIASSLPHKWHYIFSITFNTHDLIENCMIKLLTYFLSVAGLKSSKVFLIDVVRSLKQHAHNIMIFIHSSSPSTYFFKKTNEIFYMIGNQAYTIDPLNPEPSLVSQEITAEYLRLYEKEKKELIKQKKSLSF